MTDRAPPHPPAALLCDMDGVLIDTEGRWEVVERRILDRAGATAVPRAEIQGIAAGESYDLLAERDDVDLDVDRETFLDWYDEVVLTDVYPDADLLPGAAALLADVRDAGVPVAVVSSARPAWIEVVLDRLGATVDTTVSGDAIDRRGKPAPGPYAVAAERLGVDPTDCVAVEDSAVGVASATGAGAYVVGYAGGSEEPTGAHERVETPAALADRLRTLTRR